MEAGQGGGGWGFPLAMAVLRNGGCVRSLSCCRIETQIKFKTIRLQQLVFCWKLFATYENIDLCKCM